jgi:hypothetical protein
MSHSTGSEPSYQENTPAALLVQASDVNARPLRVRRMADSMLQNGQEAPFMVRERERLVLVEGLHRLEGLSVSW